MMRSDEGTLVNLTPQERPKDVYQIVTDRVKRQVKSDLQNEDKKQLAQTCLNWTWDASAPARPRKTFKRNVMTYAYSSKVYGMRKQLHEDIMAPLSERVLLGQLEKHPFGHDNGFAASQYLAEHVYSAIEQVVEGPAKAMDFLQKLARALAQEGKPLRWTSPAGVPWINSYNKKQIKRVHLWLNDRGVSVPYMATLAVAELPEIDGTRAASAVAPNFVHACDAAHLMLTVNAAISEGITSIATVHDSFGCLAARAERFREIIREQFVRMYQDHDVLAEVLDQARANLGNKKHKRMPDAPPQRGSLDLNKVLSAEYAFA
jgi:DNA-directed RNA polymerase, mitochondrial